jgi:hypothetical protein
VIEVLSRSNQRGRGRLLFADKVHRYLSTPSVQTLLLVEQDARLVYVHTRQPDSRMAEPVEVSDGTIALPCIESVLALDDVYRGLGL